MIYEGQYLNHILDNSKFCTCSTQSFKIVVLGYWTQFQHVFTHIHHVIFLTTPGCPISHLNLTLSNWR